MKTNFVKSEKYTKAKATTTSASFITPLKITLNKIFSKNPDFVFYDYDNECVGDDLLELISTLQKSEHQRGFIEGSDITGSMGVEICACKLHDQRKKYREKIKTLKDANKEDNMNGLRKIFELLEEILNK